MICLGQSKGRAGMAIKNYRRYLRDLSEELGECQRQAESAGWHHLEFGTPERSLYNRMATWQEELAERVKWYDTIQASGGKRNPKTVEGTKGS